MHLRRNAASSPLPELRDNLGRKISVRYRLHGDPAHPFSEAIGMIQNVRSTTDAGDVVEIVNRRGAVATVPVRDITAFKLWPRES